MSKSKEKILLPSKVTALRIGGESKVGITATGREDGYCNLEIVPSLAQVYPPIFLLKGEPCEAIGNFPYSVSKEITYSSDLDYIFFNMEDGTRKIPIYNIVDENAKLIEAHQDNNKAIGYAYASSDINVAIANAIAKLQERFPGNVSAKLIETGFTAVGTPVGTAFLYVIMEQQS